MVEPVSIGTGIIVLKIAAALGIAVAISWMFIRDFFRFTIIPGLERFAPRTADALLTVIKFIDNAHSNTLHAAQSAYRALKCHLVGCFAFFRQTTASSVTVETAFYHMEGNDVFCTVSNGKPVNWSDLPQEVRDQMFDHPGAKVKVNMLDEVDEMITKKKIPMELTL